MKNKHSLISPSSFQRRMLCHGSLHAEKDLPETTSVYAEEGIMLHERVASFLDTLDDVMCRQWCIGLTESQARAVKDCVMYCSDITESFGGGTVGNLNEGKYDLSFIYKDMKGTADSVLLLENEGNIEIHVIDYKFGKGVAVNAKYNRQLLLYAIGVLNDAQVKEFIGASDTTLHLHIVQPYISNSRWDLTKEERREYCDIEFYKKIAEACYDPNAKRTPHKSACRFCKAKPTCPALAKKLPKLDVDISTMSSNQIAAIYDSKDLIKMYMNSITEHMTKEIEGGGLKGYGLEKRFGNLKWVEGSEAKIMEVLGDDTYVNDTTLISVAKAKLLGKMDEFDLVELTERKIIGSKIVKVKDE